MHKKFSVYIAGPEVFLPTEKALAHFDNASQLCHRLGMQASVPYDLAIKTPEEVLAWHLQQMRDADGCVANLDPFRGVGVDDGTAYEVGFMRALDKPVIGYYLDRATVQDRVLKYFKRSGHDFMKHNGGIMPDGMIVPSWGLPFNLMIAAEPGCLIRGGLYAALVNLRAVLRNKHGLPALDAPSDAE